MPYLQRIDAHRYYSNFGPLLDELHDRFAGWLGVESNHIMTATNGMAILELIISSLNLPRGSHVILPSWTFCATAHAVLNAGLVPYFVDVDRHTWAITPSIVADVMTRIDHVSLVMLVAPFGYPLPIDTWEDFSRTYNVHIMIDGAAMALEDITPSKIIPTMLSLHATKVVSAGLNLTF